MQPEQQNQAPESNLNAPASSIDAGSVQEPTGKRRWLLVAGGILIFLVVSGAAFLGWLWVDKTAERELYAAVERMMQAVEKPELADLLAYYRESNVDVSSAHWVEDVLTPDMMKAREIQQRIIAIKNKYRDEMETHAFALVDKDGDVQLRKLPLSRLMEKSNGQELVKKALSRWTDSFQAEWLLINLALTTTGFKCAEVV